MGLLHIKVLEGYRGLGGRWQFKVFYWVVGFGKKNWAKTTRFGNFSLRDLYLVILVGDIGIVSDLEEPNTHEIGRDYINLEENPHKS